MVCRCYLLIGKIPTRRSRTCARCPSRKPHSSHRSSEARNVKKETDAILTVLYQLHLGICRDTFSYKHSRRPPHLHVLSRFDTWTPVITLFPIIPMYITNVNARGYSEWVHPCLSSRSRPNEASRDKSLQSNTRMQAGNYETLPRTGREHDGNLQYLTSYPYPFSFGSYIHPLSLHSRSYLPFLNFSPASSFPAPCVSSHSLPSTVLTEQPLAHSSGAPAASDYIHSPVPMYQP